MTKIRIALLIVVLGFCALVVYQNMGYLSAPAVLQLHLWVTDPIYVNKIVNAQLIIGAFFVGLLISYFFGLSFRFTSKRIIADLNATLNSRNQTIDALKRDLSSYQGAAPQKDSLQEEPQQPGGSAENT